MTPIPERLELLIVEDEPADMYHAERLLRRHPRVGALAIATDGSAALAILGECEVRGGFPDLIVLDLRMPNMGGIEFLKHYHRLYATRSTRILVLTGSACDPDRHAVEQFPSVFGYAVKPLLEADVLRVLRPAHPPSVESMRARMRRQQ